MKTKCLIRDDSGHIIDSTYDDETNEHEITDLFTGEVTSVIDSCGPVNISKIINGIEYTIQKDRHTRRTLRAFTTNPLIAIDFQSESDYQKFLVGAFCECRRPSVKLLYTKEIYSYYQCNDCKGFIRITNSKS